jgi:CRP-like cAMP-binding protein
MMTAQVHRLLPNRERIKRAEARDRMDEIDQWGLPVWLREKVRNELFRASEPETARPAFGKFAMFSVAQMGAIWGWIRTLPAQQRPQEVRHALDLAILHMRQDTGEVMLTRDQMAEAMKCRPDRVSQAMKVLSRAGIILTERRRVEGMRGPGIVAYFVNPHAAWNGSLAIQEIEARRQTPPLLALMEGGKD